MPDIPVDIPADVWAAAVKAMSHETLGSLYAGPRVVKVARAILAERERCATLLDSRKVQVFDVPGDARYVAEMAYSLAIRSAVDAIRKGDA